MFGQCLRWRHSNPKYLNSCDCTLCLRLGALWGYFDPSEVAAYGETKAFRRSDIEAWLDTNFCPTCSAVVSWTAMRELERPLVGVNMRLFAPDDLLGLPVRFPNNRDDDGAGERPPPRHEEVAFTCEGPF